MSFKLEYLEVNRTVELGVLKLQGFNHYTQIDSNKVTL